MIASWIRLGMTTAALSGMAATGYAFQDQLDWAKARLTGSVADPSAMGALSAAITEWRSLKDTNAAPFDNYARFLLAHPGWPGEAQMRRAAEASLAQGTWSASTAAAFFRRYPPQNATAWIRFAQALNGLNARDEAKTAARNGWVMGALSSADEAYVLATFPDALTPADHDARMDQLLWQGQIAAAGRQIMLTSPGKRPLFQARLDMRTNAPGAGNADAIGMGDAGYVADKAIWLATGAPSSARALLARPHRFTVPPTDVDRWYDLLLRNARAALAAGETSTAYAIASQVDDAYPAGTDVSLRPLGERDPYTDLVWLAGTTAMRRLARPADAIGMFVRYTGGSRSTALKSKGYYWAGRAAEAAGRPGEARDYLGRAAQYRDQFYGQLAESFRLVFYDRRGCGLSERAREDFTLEAEVADLESVIDEVAPGDSVSLLGVSQAGPICIAYAAAHPERVTRLVLVGTYHTGAAVAAKYSALRLSSSAWEISTLGRPTKVKSTFSPRPSRSLMARSKPS